MAKAQMQQVKMKQPDLSVSKGNQEKAGKLIGNFINATEKRLKPNMGKFSTLSSILGFIRKKKEDASDEFVIEVIKRMEQDKLHPQVALQISEVLMNNLQNMQKAMIFKILPFLAGFLGTSIMAILIATSDPLNLQNPWVQKYLIALAIFLPLLIWGNFTRGKVKRDMLASNIVFQGASAFASAKLQGKGKVGALQNLAEMKRRAKQEENKSKKK